MSEARSYVTESLTAKHFDPLLGEGWHEHTWRVTAFWPSEPFRDGRLLRLALRNFLDALPNAAGELPGHLWSGEALAKSVLSLAFATGARVERDEGYGAEAWP